MNLRDHLLSQASRTDADTVALAGNIIAEATLFSCTTCRACMDVCPVRIEPMTKIIEMRRAVVENGAIEPMLQDALANIQRTGNSMGKPARQRARWTQALGFKIKDARKGPVDLLWFVGEGEQFLLRRRRWPDLDERQRRQREAKRKPNP
jgi:Fe-S oxidoreductase